MLRSDGQQEYRIIGLTGLFGALLYGHIFVVEVLVRK